MTSRPENEIDTALRVWRQGDCVLGEHWFVHRFAPHSPLTEHAQRVAADKGEAGVDLAESAVRGLMIISQSCDIARSCADRPFVEVSPLVELTDDVFKEAKRGRRPQFAVVPGVATRRLAADLDRVMTVEKAVVTEWDRTPGCESDSARRDLAKALARKRTRVAFPDDFVVMVGPLQERLQKKHDKKSNEGRALRALLEIRVRAAPSWDDDSVVVTLWFIRGAGKETFEGKDWETFCQAWLGLVTPTGRFQNVDGFIVTLEDLTARDYVESDPLDLDHLSTRES